jgi:hypothetical protein
MGLLVQDESGKAFVPFLPRSLRGTARASLGRKVGRRCMMIWKKKREEKTSESSVARAALAGASHEELVREALKTLTADESADRIGVWLVPDSNPGRIHEFSPVFSGLVWDHAVKECPREWMHLSLEPPLPEELLIGGKPVEQHLEASPENTVIGQLVGLRHAIWIPISNRRQVKGLILVGSKAKPLGSTRERAESVAAELALALELEDQQSFTRVRSADLTLARHFLEISFGDSSVETRLTNLAASCTARTANGSGPGAAFTAIGAIQNLHGTSGETIAVEFRWRSGDEQWTRAVESEPLAGVGHWKHAASLAASRPRPGESRRSLASWPIRWKCKGSFWERLLRDCLGASPLLPRSTAWICAPFWPRPCWREESSWTWNCRERAASRSCSIC